MDSFVSVCSDRFIFDRESFVGVCTMKTEKVPIFIIFKEDGNIKTEMGPDSNDFELYGFLKCFVKQMEEGLINDIVPRDKDDEDVF